MSSLMRTNPASGDMAVSRLHNDIDRLFGGFFRAPLLSTFFDTPQGSLAPQVDIKSDDKGYHLSVELPGVAPEDVKVELKDNMLVLSGEKKEETCDKDSKVVSERRYGSFMRSFSLPEDADAEKITATAQNGILSLELPRKECPAEKTRTIEIQKA